MKNLSKTLLLGSLCLFSGNLLAQTCSLVASGEIAESRYTGSSTYSVPNTCTNVTVIIDGHSVSSGGGCGSTTHTEDHYETYYRHELQLTLDGEVLSGGTATDVVQAVDELLNDNVCDYVSPAQCRVTAGAGKTAKITIGGKVGEIIMRATTAEALLEARKRVALLSIKGLCE